MSEQSEQFSYLHLVPPNSTDTIGGSAKKPGREFLMDCEKDKIGKFERGYLESNHRKVSGFGLSQDAKRPVMIFGTAAEILTDYHFSGNSVSRQWNWGDGLSGIRELLLQRIQLLW